jgi:hypothetical protein
MLQLCQTHTLSTCCCSLTRKASSDSLLVRSSFKCLWYLSMQAKLAVLCHVNDACSGSVNTHGSIQLQASNDCAIQMLRSAALEEIIAAVQLKACMLFRQGLPHDCHD